MEWRINADDGTRAEHSEARLMCDVGAMGTDRAQPLARLCTDTRWINTIIMCQQQDAVQRDTAQRLTATAAQHEQVQQCIASVGDEMLGFQRQIAELEAPRRITPTVVRTGELQAQLPNPAASGIAELFTELVGAARLGISVTIVRVADEAGDAWYGAQCYAAAYTEQVRRVLEGWTNNMKASAADTHVPNQLFPPTPGEQEAQAQAQHAPVAANREISKNINNDRTNSKNRSHMVDLTSPGPDASFGIKTTGKASEHTLQDNKCEENAKGDAAHQELVYNAAGNPENAVSSASGGRQHSIRKWLQQATTPTEVARTAMQRPVLPSLSDAVWVDGIPTWPDEAHATLAEGSVDHPILIDSDDDTAIRPHCSQPLLPEVVINAQLLLQPMRNALAQTGSVDSAVREVVSHQIMEMAESLDYEASSDQVYERFRSDSTRSFEARGAVMLGMHADYASALQARIQPGPSSAQGAVDATRSTVREGHCSAPA